MNCLLGAASCTFSLTVFIALLIVFEKRFVPGTTPRGMKFILAISVLAGTAFVYEAWFGILPWPALVAGLGLQLTGIVLFCCTVAATRNCRLTAAFEIDEPKFLLRTGPYGFVRHPFYTSYQLFWFGCAAATLSPVCTVFSLVLAFTYVVAARKEERKFEHSTLSAEYAFYTCQAGIFWPRLSTKRKESVCRLSSEKAISEMELAPILHVPKVNRVPV